MLLVEVLCTAYLSFVIGPFLLYILAMFLGFTRQSIPADDSAIYLYDDLSKAKFPVVEPGTNRWGEADPAETREQEMKAGEESSKSCRVARYAAVHLRR